MNDTADQDHLPVLRAGAAMMGIALDDGQIAQFARLRALLLEWNTRVNLTAITDAAEVESRHFLDSLTIALAIPRDERPQAIRMLDVGSGAGFPALPLAIAFPRWRVTSLEATGKKVRFQQEAIADLGLSNVRAVHGRAEELAHQTEERGRYHVVTARAVAALPTLLEYCCPFARIGGRVVMPKKGGLDEEMTIGKRAAGQVGARLLDPLVVAIPPLADGRVLLIAEQQRRCPLPYPRPAGAPTRHPLGTITTPRH